MAIHTEYSLRHKVEFRPEDVRTPGHPYHLRAEQTWHRSQTPMPLYVMDHSAVHISLTPGRMRGRQASWTSSPSPEAVNDAVEDCEVYTERGPCLCASACAR